MTIPEYRRLKSYLEDNFLHIVEPSYWNDKAEYSNLVGISLLVNKEQLEWFFLKDIVVQDHATVEEFLEFLIQKKHIVTCHALAVLQGDELEVLGCSEVYEKYFIKLDEPDLYAIPLLFEVP